MRRSPRRPCLAALAFLAVTAACSGRDVVRCGWDASDVPVARITADEIARAPRLRPSELWRAGGVDGGASLTNPTSARVGPDGTLAIPDFGASTVWLLGSDGAWLDPVGEAGEGPGEFTRPLAAAWTEGGELLVLDAGDRSVTRFDRGMRLVGREAVPADLIAPVFAAGEIGWFGLRSDGVAFLEHPATEAAGDSAEIVYAAGGAGDPSARVVHRSTYPAGLVPALDRIRRPDWPRALMAVGARSRAVAPASDRYELIIFGPDEAPRLYLCSEDDEVVETSRGEGPEVPERVRATLDTLRAPARPALFSRLVIDRDGRLWVERDPPRPGDAFDRMYGVPGATLDLISPSGRLLARVRMPTGLRFQDALGDTVWAFAIGELDEVTVAAGALEEYP